MADDPNAGYPVPGGLPRSYYATPFELRRRPWALDFTPDNIGAQSFPLEYMLCPYRKREVQPAEDGNPALFTIDALEWRVEDWDPALRFWTLPYDPQLNEWLRVADRTLPSTLAAREFGGQPALWHPAQIDPVARRFLEAGDLSWRVVKGPDAPEPQVDATIAAAWTVIVPELTTLVNYMEDDRGRYLDECDVQADNLADYLLAFIRADRYDHPWTFELVNCGLAIGNVAYMAYKAHYRRVRPSALRPGLIPPFGPPEHPAFPSGHAFLAHFLALLLLEIPALAETVGVYANPVVDPGTALPRAPTYADLTGTGPIASPLLRISHRIALNRERLGVHYPSDSSAGRHLAAGIWDAIRPEPQNPALPENGQILCPTLRNVIARAGAEWHRPWPG